MSGTHVVALPVQRTAPHDAAPVDLHRDLAELRDIVEQARAMPMSGSCVVNRGEALGLIDQLHGNLTLALKRATKVEAERTEIIHRAHEEAEQIISAALSTRDALVSDSEVFRVASSQADQLLTTATEETQMLRRDTDDYVEGRLAALETSLRATLEAVGRGRSRLRGRNKLAELG